MFSPKRILVPTDFSNHSDKALNRALEIAQEYGSKVYLLHVVDENIQQCAVDYCINPALIEQMTVESNNASKAKMEKQAKKARGSKDIDVISAVRQGIPYTEIVNYELKNKIDLVVMAPHGRSGILSHLMGSVADKVVHFSKCPVLLLRE